MRSSLSRLLRLAALGVLGPSLLTLSAAKPRKIDVVAVTDMTRAGREWAAPTPESPVFYQAVTTGYQTFGRTMGKDREPENDEFIQVVLQTLKKEGYIPSTEANPPSIVLGFAWGSLRADFGGALSYLGGKKLDLMWETRNSGQLDARVLLRGLRSEAADRVMETAKGDLYVVTIAAYDRQALLEGRLVELWQTRISCPTRGVYAADALPQIVQAAGPVIGRETDIPEIFNTRTGIRNRGEVSIGEITTVEEDYDLSQIDLLDLTKE